MQKVLVLNGPNLGRLGSREPEVYGNASFADLTNLIEAESKRLGFDAEIRQTDDDGTLIGWIHEAVDSGCDVVLNPAAFTHYSYALRDACAMLGTAGLYLVEVHLSNPHAREEFRHRSVISGVATGVIAGFGQDSYRLALIALSEIRSNINV